MAQSSAGSKVKFSVRSRQKEKSGVKKVHRVQPLTADGSTSKTRRGKISTQSPNRKTLKSAKSCAEKLRLTTSIGLSNPRDNSSSNNPLLSCHLEKPITNRRFLIDVLDAEDPLFASTDVDIIDVSGKSLTVLQKSLFKGKCWILLTSGAF